MSKHRVLAGLRPTTVWNFFEDLTRIPRPSKHEAQVLSFLRDFALQRNIRVTSDKIGNLVMHRPGQNGGEEAPAILIQGHVDMVTEKGV